LLGVVVAGNTLAQVSLSGTSAVLPSLVGEDRVGEANARIALTNGLIFGIGPGAAAACFSFLGARATILAIIALYLPAAACLRLIRAPASTTAERQSRILADLRSGIVYVLHSTFLRAIMLVVFVDLLGFGALSVLDVVFANRVLRAGTAGVGVLLTASGIGETLGAVAVTLVARSLRNGYHRVLGLSVIAQGLGFLAYALAPNLMAASAVLLAVGFTFAPLEVAFMTLTQLATEDPYRGRVMGLLNMAVAVALIVSMAWGGFLADRFSVRQVLAVAACITIVAGVTALGLLRSMPVPGQLPATTGASALLSTSGARQQGGGYDPV
jgi:predicted MFS family arabinose efflux permease